MCMQEYSGKKSYLISGSGFKFQVPLYASVILVKLLKCSESQLNQLVKCEFITIAYSYYKK